MTTDDMVLIKEYVLHNSELAFQALVSRHVNLVYSVALRQTQDANLAEELTQEVFIILGRKAQSLNSRIVLSGWLCRTARYVCSNAVKIRQRRQRREQEAYMRSLLNESDETAWARLAPVLDAAMAHLGEKEHDAVVLRFFSGKSFKEIGAAMGNSEEAARKRVHRALQKLQSFFTTKGVVLSAGLLEGALAANSVQAAPAALQNVASAAALAKGASANSSTTTLIKGALKLMTWSKAKTIVAASLLALLAGGISAVKFKTLHDQKYYAWRVPKFNSVQNEYIRKVPPQVRILPSKFSEFGGEGSYDSDIHMGICTPVAEIIEHAYSSYPPFIVFSAELPKGNFDYIANLPHGSSKALQEEIKHQFGLVGKKEVRQMKAFSLELSNRDFFKPPGTLRAEMNVLDPNIHETNVFVKGSVAYTVYFDCDY